MNLSIIKLGKQHLNACIDLDQKSLNGLWSRSQWEKELSNPIRICLGAKEIETNKLLGLCSAWLIADELYITSIAVHPTHQRQGIGKSLMTDLIKRSTSFRINNIYLEVKDKNEPAKAFYKSMGFKMEGNRFNFYKDGSNALIFNKQINK
tara:strand:+ start:653 stop:1102 length:450 start_codon:yes stop_codon:yes gene_type:complete